MGDGSFAWERIGGTHLLGGVKILPHLPRLFAAHFLVPLRVSELLFPNHRSQPIAEARQERPFGFWLTFDHELFPT